MYYYFIINDMTGILFINIKLTNLLLKFKF